MAARKDTTACFIMEENTNVLQQPILCENITYNKIIENDIR